MKKQISIIILLIALFHSVPVAASDEPPSLDELFEAEIKNWVEQQQPAELFVKEKVTTFSTKDSPFSKIGTQLTNTYPMSAVAGEDKQGTPLLFTIMQGEPTALVVMNLNNEEIIDKKDLPGAKGAWALEWSNGKAWIGTTPNEHVYTYDPNNKNLLDLGKVSTEKNTTIWDLEYVPSKQLLFGGNSYEGGVFQYKDGKFYNFGQLVQGKTYARSVAFDETSDSLFIGLGSKAELIAWDMVHNQKQSILPSKYQNESYVYDLDAVDGIVFAKLNPSQKILLFDGKTRTFLGEIPASSRGVSAKSPIEDAVYYTYENSLFRFDLNTRTTTEIPARFFNRSAISLDYVRLNDPNYPGYTLFGLLGNDGRYFKYNLKNGNSETGNLTLPSQPIEIYSLTKGSDNNILSSGFVSGNLAIYDPDYGTTRTFTGIRQVESTTSLRGKTYFGTYPGAEIVAADLSQQSGTSLKAEQIGSLSSYGQDRPVAMLGIESLNKIFIGTFPKPGVMGGALAVYEHDSNQLDVQPNLIENQSIISLAYRKQDGFIYGGTSVYGGKGDTTLANKAVVFRLPADNPSQEPEIIPLPLGSPRLISALTVTDDGRLWGMADGNLFVTRLETMVTTMIPIVKNTSGYLRNASLHIGKDGHIYGSVQRVMFRVNTESNEVTILRNNNDVDFLVQDDHGDFYFKNGADLWKADFEKLSAYGGETVEKDRPIPHVTQPSGHPYPVARLSLRENCDLLKYENGVYTPVKKLSTNEFYRVYGTKGDYYDVGGGYYVRHQQGKTYIYIGRLLIHKKTKMYTPDGQVYRTLQPGEAVRVYNYNDYSYDVGGGYTVRKNANVDYFVGYVTIKRPISLKHETKSIEQQLATGNTYPVFNMSESKLDLGNGYYINLERKNITYSKN